MGPNHEDDDDDDDLFGDLEGLDELMEGDGPRGSREARKKKKLASTRGKQPKKRPAKRADTEASPLFRVIHVKL